MSQENVEIVTAAPRAFNRRDMEAFLEGLDPDVEWIPIMASLEGLSIATHDGVRRWVEELDTDWESFEVGRDLYDPGDRILILGHWCARGRASGVVLENQPASWLYEISTARSWGAHVHRPSRSPRSRRPLGVGDVAGERGARAGDICGLGAGRFSSADWAHRDIEFGFADGPEPGRWTGREAMSRRYGEFLRGFKAFRAEPERYFVVDEHRILVLVRRSGRAEPAALSSGSGPSRTSLRSRTAWSPDRHRLGPQPRPRNRRPRRSRRCRRRTWSWFGDCGSRSREVDLTAVDWDDEAIREMSAREVRRQVRRSCEGQARAVPARPGLRRHGAAPQGAESVPRIMEGRLQALRPLARCAPVLPAGYCAGDVAGERGGRAAALRSVERGRHGRPSSSLPTQTSSCDPRRLARAGAFRRSRGGHARVRTAARDLGDRRGGPAQRLHRCWPIELW